MPTNGGEETPKSDHLLEKDLAGTGKDPASPVLDKKPFIVPPMPPTPSGQPLQVQLGMQFVQQSALSFDRVDKDVQLEMLVLVEKMDQRAFENAQTNLRCQHEQEMAKAKHTSDSLRRVLYVGCGLAGGILLIGAAITRMLIQKGQPQLAHTLMMSGFAALGCLLGGAGIAGFIGKFTRSGDVE